MGRKKLKVEQNTPDMAERIIRAFDVSPEGLGEHEHCEAEAVFEHGQWYVNDKTCGAQWSANDASGPGSVDGFSFEQISEGDEDARRDANPEEGNSEDEEPSEPEEGDITTEDHQRWFQDGKLYFEGDEAGLKAKMDTDKFWPNVWFVSDHGNAHLIKL